MATIRQLRNDEAEWQAFLRFLELAYGAPYDLFPHKYPHWYVRDTERLKVFWVVEDEGRIVAHVGLFPFEVHVDDVSIRMGGIGGVATHPGHRGRGHMSRLLKHVTGQMEQCEWPVSVLWGLRARYRPFGWDVAGVKYEATFTRRAFGGLWDNALDVAEVDPSSAAADVEALYATDNLWIRRTDVPRQLGARNLRMWLAEGAYACGQRTESGLHIFEAHSRGDNVPALIAGVMRRLHCDTATLPVGADDRRLDALWDAAVGWQARPEGCFRINNSVRCLTALRPILERRLAGTGAGGFSRVIHVTRDSMTESFAVRYDGEALNIAESNEPPDAVLAWEPWVQLLLGGPVCPTTRALLGPLATALPVSLHIPALDHI